MAGGTVAGTVKINFSKFLAGGHSLFSPSLIDVRDLAIQHADAASKPDHLGRSREAPRRGNYAVPMVLLTPKLRVLSPYDRSV
jgi:hypothetical protein